jgi:hypothetical protein
MKFAGQQICHVFLENICDNFEIQLFYMLGIDYCDTYM